MLVLSVLGCGSAAPGRVDRDRPDDTDWDTDYPCIGCGWQDPWPDTDCELGPPPDPLSEDCLNPPLLDGFEGLVTETGTWFFSMLLPAGHALRVAHSGHGHVALAPDCLGPWTHTMAWSNSDASWVGRMQVMDEWEGPCRKFKLDFEVLVEPFDYDQGLVETFTQASTAPALTDGLLAVDLVTAADDLDAFSGSVPRDRCGLLPGPDRVGRIDVPPEGRAVITTPTTSTASIFLVDMQDPYSPCVPVASNQSVLLEDPRDVGYSWFVLVDGTDMNPVEDVLIRVTTL